MIHLRELREEDAPLMLEWMHNPETQKFFRKKMQDASLTDTIQFCKAARIPQSLENGLSIHFAISDDNDEYLGTISLKKIDKQNRNAEYAISVRKTAQGRGVATEATKLLLEKAFHKYDLERVYLNVLANNTAAIHLYEKCGFKYEGEFRKHLLQGNEYVSLRWYGILKEEYYLFQEENNDIV